MEDSYYYCIHDDIPFNNSHKGAYVFKYKSGIIFSSNINSRIVLSPIFDSYQKIKSWISDNGFISEPQFKKEDGTFSNYQPFRLKRLINLKKTQKMLLPSAPPRIVEIDNTPEIGLKDEYIVVCSGKIEKV